MIKKNLIILTADKNTQILLQTLIKRMQKVENLQPFNFEVIVHPKRDPGVATNCHEFLRLFLSSHDYCIVLLDHEGSGKERILKMDLEREIEKTLSINGWKERNCCIVIKPELEIWLWVNAVQIHRLIDWEEEVNIYEWLKLNGIEFIDNKPTHPKEVFEILLRKQGIARSSSLYSKLAETASYRNCKDISFQKLRITLNQWFPPVD